ncbi:MAG TPA: hypothetical protein VJQ54_25215, partial [Candidatus Sulfotelmatobacter sp.]|nr:hypothetical protein [Candidatus Sulfotelmatobacter sp.]
SRNSYQYNNFQPKVDSNPIAPRVRRKRQRLPPSLLIENASDQHLSHPKSPPEAFPIKASDNTSGETQYFGNVITANGGMRNAEEEE